MGVWRNWERSSLASYSSGFDSPYFHHIKTHYLPDRKSRGKLQEKEVRILGTGNVFLYGAMT